jgi:hypothetical protein
MRVRELRGSIKKQGRRRRPHHLQAPRLTVRHHRCPHRLWRVRRRPRKRIRRHRHRLMQIEGFSNCPLRRTVRRQHLSRAHRQNRHPPATLACLTVLRLLLAKRPLTEQLKSLLVVSRSSARLNRPPLPPPRLMHRIRLTHPPAGSPSSASPNRLPTALPPRPRRRVRSINPPGASPSSASLNPLPTPPALLQHPTPPNRRINPPAGLRSSASLNPPLTPPALLQHLTPPNRRINPPAGLRSSASPNRPLLQWSPRQRLAQQAQQ